MIDKRIQNVSGTSKLSGKKKPYKSPVFQVFGQLNRVTQGTGPANGDAGQNMMISPMSDRNAKEKIVRIGEHPLGIGLYLFDYKPKFRDQYGHGRQFGVMADEVETVMPEAVSLHPDGYKRVNYGMLGITLGVQ